MGILPSLNYQSATENLVGSKKINQGGNAQRRFLKQISPLCLSLSSGGSCETTILEKRQEINVFS